MATLLHIDASARAGRSGIDRHGSHTRRLSARFVDRWRLVRPDDTVLYRDVGRSPPRPVTEDWITAAFTPPDRRQPWMHEALAESDELVAEVTAADILVIGAPMYNFGMPAPLKAWIDNIVRVGVTFGFDRRREGVPYWPMLAPGKRLVILGSRGDHGYDPGGRIAHLNLVETGLSVPFAYIGLTRVDAIATEYDEFADERLAASLNAAETAIDRLADRIGVDG
ncbi:MAG TPA: NAD(P)H-dependent oxidoreductase [Aliidongia sp.]|uniref:FMN-dependent NADH-azoreductase n=1 Tax=Aliidongia sp. TaxID=1914230 RepID=UPI002DDD612B|nr:NAD(P)H-dependent oxidoreductase [Aliidongia sp.]HEV2672940.1 NAD(P)H-dependent oxidoreductase [Aliidongia sp.]